MPVRGIIYALYNTVDSTFYIGSTIHSLNRRMIEHCSAAKREFYNQKYTTICATLVLINSLSN